MRGYGSCEIWVHIIQNENNFARHADYLHIKPIKHGYAKQVAEWPHSSFHRHVRAGILPMDWGGDAIEELKCGERVQVD